MTKDDMVLVEFHLGGVSVWIDKNEDRNFIDRDFMIGYAISKLERKICNEGIGEYIEDIEIHD